MRASAIVATGFLAAAIAFGTSALAGSSVILNMYNLIQIEAGEGHYHLWAIVNGSPVTLGAFNMDADGIHLDDLQGHVIPNQTFTTPADLTAASEIWISVEPETSSDLTPSNHHVLAGTVE